MNESDLCSLDGCGVLIEQPPGDGPRRKYCCAEHRAAGRRVRRASQANRKIGADEVFSLRTAFTVPPERLSVPDEVSVDDTMNAELLEPVEDEPVRPKASRRREPVKPEKVRRVRRGKNGKKKVASGKGRQAAIAFGTVGALVGGAIMVTNEGALLPSSGGKVPPAGQSNTQSLNAGRPPQPVAVSGPENLDQWADQLKVRLASVHKQLGDLQSATKQYQASSAKAPAKAADDPVKQAQAQAQTLQQQEMALESLGSGIDSLKQTQTMYDGAQEESARLSKAMDALPLDQASPASTAAREQLSSQLGAVTKRRDMLKGLVDGAQTGIATTMANPPADLAKTTEPIVNSVLALTKRQPDKPKQPTAGQPQTPAVVPHPAKTVPKPPTAGTSAPPDPSRPAAPAPSGGVTPPDGQVPGTAVLPQPGLAADPAAEQNVVYPGDPQNAAYPGVAQAYPDTQLFPHPGAARNPDGLPQTLPVPSSDPSASLRPATGPGASPLPRIPVADVPQAALPAVPDTLDQVVSPGQASTPGAPQSDLDRVNAVLDQAAGNGGAARPAGGGVSDSPPSKADQAHQAVDAAMNVISDAVHEAVAQRLGDKGPDSGPGQGLPSNAAIDSVRDKAHNAVAQQLGDSAGAGPVQDQAPSADPTAGSLQDKVREAVTQRLTGADAGKSGGHGSVVGKAIRLALRAAAQQNGSSAQDSLPADASSDSGGLADSSSTTASGGQGAEASPQPAAGSRTGGRTPAAASSSGTSKSRPGGAGSSAATPMSKGQRQAATSGSRQSKAGADRQATTGGSSRSGAGSAPQSGRHSA
ncbi:hypothetical protein [Amycolatopsis sp. H20-H5]|uniref:hypothetical protein n=1 Tax=Amycolatopsis sp. H20-H5 TaxID=3046309 RepID=UPI002DB5C3F3|nr:hypothetical protein [Amycolatopsis sp. H20-H5]MEC3976613.1 hypothetical protein [Amycolatopsis sp. H20-H5]